MDSGASMTPFDIPLGCVGWLDGECFYRQAEHIVIRFPGGVPPEGLFHLAPHYGNSPVTFVVPNNVK